MNPQLQAAAAQLLRTIALAFQAIRLYPPGHPALARAEEHVRTVWGIVLGAGHEITLDTYRSEVLIDGELLDRIPPELMVELGPAARQARHAEMRFRGADGAEQLLDTLRALGRPVAGGASAGRRTGAIPLSTAPVAAPDVSDTPPSHVTASPTGPVPVVPAPATRTGGMPVAAASAAHTTGPVQAAILDVHQAVHALSSYWIAIEQAGRRDDALLRWLTRFVIGQAGDGLARPVELIAGTGSNPVVEHALDTARLVALAARASGLGGQALAVVIEAALCADIGMRGVPAELVQRPLRLGQDEFRSIRRHPVAGARWLLATPGVPELAGVVAFEHHVRRDGKGYPQMARASELHPVSRLVQAADTYAALRTARPFRPALGEAEARQLLRRLATTALDPPAVEVLLTRAAPAGCANLAG